MPTPTRNKTQNYIRCNYGGHGDTNISKVASLGVQQIATEPPPPGAHQASNRQRWIDLGLILLIAVVPSILTAVYMLLYPDAAERHASNFRILVGIFREISAIVLLGYVLSRQNRGWKSIGLDFRWSDPLIAIGLCIAARLGESVLSYFVRHGSLFLLGRAPIWRHPDFFSGALGVLSIAYSISAPIFEETVVRGYFTTELIQLGKPVWLATLASIVLQTSYHVYYGIGGAVAISGVFIVFAIYFAKSRRLLPAILAHIYWDLLLALLYLRR